MIIIKNNYLKIEYCKKKIKFRLSKDVKYYLLKTYKDRKDSPFKCDFSHTFIQYR
jgi:hypothetical protein